MDYKVFAWLIIGQFFIASGACFIGQDNRLGSFYLLSALINIVVVF